jgi:hypothetical protein
MASPWQQLTRKSQWKTGLRLCLIKMVGYANYQKSLFLLLRHSLRYPFIIIRSYTDLRESSSNGVAECHHQPPDQQSAQETFPSSSNEIPTVFSSSSVLALRPQFEEIATELGLQLREEWSVGEGRRLINKYMMSFCPQPMACVSLPGRPRLSDRPASLLPRHKRWHRGLRGRVSRP